MKSREPEAVDDQVLSDVAPRTRTDARKVEGTDTLSGMLRLFARFPTPRLFAAKAAVLFGVRATLGPPTIWDGVVLAAIAVYWPLQEWALHATLLHLEPRKVFGLRVDPYFARKHRWHHRHPWVLEGTFLPLRTVLPLVPVNLALWWLVAPTPASAVTGMLGMTLAALAYELAHYLAHTPYKPKSAYLERVQHNHRLHHFKNEKHWYAFTVPHIDELMGTGGDVGSVPKSSTTRTLGVDDAA